LSVTSDIAKSFILHTVKKSINVLHFLLRAHDKKTNLEKKYLSVYRNAWQKFNKFLHILLSPLVSNCIAKM
jgi:hypothetical protein